MEPQGIATVVAVLLAGIAAAGLVTGPPSRLRRLRAPAAGAPSLRTLPGTDLVPPSRPDAITVGRRLFAGASSGVATLLVVRTMEAVPAAVGWALGILVAALMIVTLGRLESPASRRRRLQMVTDLPHVLELLTAAIGAGLPLRGATRAVADVADGPLAEDLDALVKAIDLGQTDAEAWRELRDHPALGRVAVDLARSVDSGTMVTETLRRHARAARRERHGALEARAKTVGVKTVPALMVCLVPSFLLISIVPSAVTAFQGITF
jgi:pilus assembly protein TadC